MKKPHCSARFYQQCHALVTLLNPKPKHITVRSNGRQAVYARSIWLDTPKENALKLKLEGLKDTERRFW